MASGILEFRSKIKKLFSRSLEYLFPWYCVLCDEPSPNPLCDNCENQRLLKIKYSCPYCGKPRRTNLPGIHCSHCQNEHFAFHRVVSTYIYNNDARKIHHEFKYNQGIAYLKQIIPSFIDTLQKVEWGSVLPMCVVPVPTSFWQYFRKGYNQAYIISEIVSKELNLPLVNCLKRRNHQRSQTGLSKTARKKNVQKAFYFDRNISLPSCVLLIDDLMTTGYTLSECARILRKNKVKRVFCATIFTLPKYSVSSDKEIDLDYILKDF